MPVYFLLRHSYPILPASCSFSYHALNTVGLYALGLWWHEIKVYRWGFPCLNYSFDVLVLWSCDLKPYNQICSSSAYLVLSLYTCLPLLATWLLPHHSPGEFWLLWILMSRFWSLERVDSPSCWSEWRSGSVDLQRTALSSILPGPPVCLSSFPFVNSWVPVYCSYLYISLYSRNYVYQGCNIHVILDHLWW